MTIETSKTLGGVGALLMFIGIIPVINSYGVIELVGLILVMVALYNLASYYTERGIFNNALYGLIAGIVGGVIAVGVVILSVLTSLTDFLYTIYPSWNGDWSALSGLTPDTSNLSLDAIGAFPYRTFRSPPYPLDIRYYWILFCTALANLAFSKIKRWLVLNSWVTYAYRCSVNHSCRHRVTPDMDCNVASCNSLLPAKTATDTTCNTNSNNNPNLKTLTNFFLFSNSPISLNN